MSKNIIKEIIMVLLLALAIILVLGVLLYEYVPANKIIPEKVSYTTPEEVKTELETDVNENDEELYVDYHIDSTQIRNYQKIQEYVPGRKNPFGSLESQETSTTTNEGEQNRSSTSNTGSTQNSGSTTNSGTSTTGQGNTGYLPDKGTK